MAIGCYIANVPLPKEVMFCFGIASSDEADQRAAFRRWLPDGAKAEFIDGALFIHPAHAMAHFNVVIAVASLLQTFRSVQDEGTVGCQTDLVALTRNDYMPDVCWWSGEKSLKFSDETSIYPAPDLVVEVLSPSTESADRGVKFQDYAYHGIAEYWIISPEDQVIEQYVLREAAYSLKTKISTGLLRSAAIGGIEFPVEAIFSDDVHRGALSAIWSK